MARRTTRQSEPWTGLYRDFATQEELDAEYDVEGIHPDMASVEADFMALTTAAEATLARLPDQRFGPTRDEHVDVYPAVGESPRPVLVFIHGGWWRKFTSKHWAFAASGPVAAGVDVVVSNYSLCPAVSIDEITRQSRATVAWVREHAAEWGGDPERIFVAGHSAGGHQVAMLLSTDWTGDYGLPADVIRGGVAISGVFDLRPLPYTFVGPSLQLSRRTIETQSPVLRLPSSAPPLLVSYGAKEPDEFGRQSEDYLAAWLGAGLPGESFMQPDADHFTAITGLAETGSPLTQRVLRFIDDVAPAGAPFGTSDPEGTAHAHPG